MREDVKKIDLVGRDVVKTATTVQVCVCVVRVGVCVCVRACVRGGYACAGVCALVETASTSLVVMPYPFFFVAPGNQVRLLRPRVDYWRHSAGQYSI